MGDNDKVGDVELHDTPLVENYSDLVVKAWFKMVFAEDLTQNKGTVPADFLRNIRMWFLMKKWNVFNKLVSDTMFHKGKDSLLSTVS